MSCFTSGQSSTSTPGYSKEQRELQKSLAATYSPYVGTGTIGGMSDLEQSTLAGLKGAAPGISEKLYGTAGSLLTGELGAKPISNEEAAKTFEESVVNPTMKSWNETWKPSIQEEYAGPGYWGSARADAVTKSGRDVGDWLGTERANWMWDVGKENRSIEEAKAGRALSALGTSPSALTTWTGQLFGQGAAAREVENAITDPQVLNVISMLLGNPSGMATSNNYTEPSMWDKWMMGTDAAAGALKTLGLVG